MGVIRVTAYPNQNLDYMWIKNGTASQSLIDSTLVANFIPAWDDGTLLLANYNDGTLDAGNILNIPVDIEFWNVFRRQNGTLQQVGRFPVDTTEIYDYVVGNDMTYDYLIFPETNTLAGSPISSNSVTTNWWNYALMSFNEPADGNNYSLVDEIWLFDFDLTTTDFGQNINRNVYNGLTQFPKVSVGQLNYLSGSISALLGNISCTTFEYSDTVEMQQQFRNFINNDKRKLLKSRKGNISVVETVSNSFKVADNFPDQHTRVNFGVVEIGNESDVSVISLVEQEAENILAGEGSSLLGGDNSELIG